MISNILLLIAGLVLVLVGADALVDGASGMARKWGVSEFVIGLTVVALGTSAPEMVVSFIGSIEGNSDIAVGNILGSNIFNTALILGLTALIWPVTITESNRKRDIPINIGVTLLFILIGMSATVFHLGEDRIGRIGGGVFLLLFAWYIIISFKNDKAEVEEDDDSSGQKSMAIYALMLAGGLAALVFGGRLFVDSAQKVAQMAGLTDKFIAVTVLAFGTSLPELATSIVAAAKGKGQMALGNVLGSNTFNILLILGGSALICPLNMGGMNWVDMGALLLTSLFVLVASWTGTKGKIDRAEGGVLVAIFAAYMAWLIANI